MAYNRNNIKIFKLVLFIVIFLKFINTNIFAIENKNSFDDIKGHFAESSIKRWENLGIIKGYDNNFFPNKEITRGDFALILDRLLKYQTKKENDFIDLGKEYFSSALLKANNKNIFQGYDNKIDPLRYITRQEAAVVLYRAFGLENEIDKIENKEFNDSLKIASWAKEALNYLVSKKIILGYNEHIYPNKPITRAEFMIILDRMIEQVIYNQNFINYNNFELNDKNSTISIIIVQSPNVTFENINSRKKIIITEACDNGTIYIKNSDKVDLLLYEKYKNLNLEIDNSSIEKIKILKNKDSNNMDVDIDKKMNELISKNNVKITKKVEIKNILKDEINVISDIKIQNLKTSDKYKPSFGNTFDGEEVIKPIFEPKPNSNIDKNKNDYEISPELKNIILVTDYTHSDYKIHIPLNKSNNILKILSNFMILADSETGEISTLPIELEYINLSEYDFNKKDEYELFAKIKNSFNINEILYKPGILKINVIIE